MKTDVMNSSSALVEHVRATHFTLIALSAGLILFLSLLKPYSSSNALEQLNEILQMEKLWSPQWIKTFGLFSGPETARGAVTVDFPFSCTLDRHRGSLAYQGEITKDWVVYGTTSWSPASFPKTLSEFESWWNGLLKSQRVDFIDEVAGGTFYLANSKQTYPLVVSSVPDLSQNDRTLKLEAIVGNPDTGELKLKGRLPNPDPEGYVELPVIATRRSEIDQSSLIQRQLKQVKPGEFSRSFPDLSAAARGLESFELEQVQAQLSQEASRDSDASFDTGWLRIPAQQMTSAGILAVLFVQMYFLTNLRELVNRLHASDPGWDTPWIGIYQSALAQTLVFISAVLLPLSALLLIVLQGCSRWISLSGGDWISKIAQKGILLSVLWGILGTGSLVLSCLLSCICWKLCRQLQLMPRRNLDDAKAEGGREE